LILGLQGDPSAPYQKVAATCKHYAGYDLEYWNGVARYSFDATISTQDMRDYYLPPFQTCARDSNVQAVMCSYNAVNGVPTCADPYLLQTVLREHWDWDRDERYVVSDCDAVQNIFNGTSWNVPSLGHNYTSTPEEAVASALNAGTDLNCGNFYAEFLGSAYDQGLYTISTLDRSLARRYASLVKLGYFDSPADQPYRQLSFSNVSMKSSQTLALRAAEEGIVLLKNDGTLPLGNDVQTVALIGPLANATEQMQGNYFGVAPYLHSPLFAAQEAGFKVSYVQGTNVSNGTSGIVEAMEAAKMADVVIYVGGIDITVEAESMVNPLVRNLSSLLMRSQDRFEISWPLNQLALISQLSAISKKFIVVQMGTQVDSALLVSNPGVNSLVWAGYPGQDGGTAIFNILTGKTVPAGRLPITQYPVRVPQLVEDIILTLGQAEYVDQVPMTNMSLQAYSSTNYNLNNPG
jgi:beta-D-xylosidase 4